MVKGIKKFRTHFRDYEQQFVLIGGAACDEWFMARNLTFRATKDLDIALVIEALTPAFQRHFWAFVRDGRYQVRERASGGHEYFRFLKPLKAGYPAKLELFSRQPEGLTLFDGQEIIPVRAGEDISSLSAILMNEDYYRLILNTRVTLDHLPMVRAEGLIPLKARAWLDLTRRKQDGVAVDADDIIKHRNDVFRLVLILPAGGQIALPEPIRADLRSFLKAFPADSPDWPNILDALRNTIRRPPNSESLREVMVNYFLLKVVKGRRSPSSNNHV